MCNTDGCAYLVQRNSGGQPRQPCARYDDAAVVLPSRTRQQALLARGWGCCR